MIIRIAIGILLYILIIRCGEKDDLSLICNPPFVFTNAMKNEINFDLISEQIFDPYCQPCHSMSDWGLSEIRSGFLPLDSRTKSVLNSDINFQNLMAYYIDFNTPENSKLIQSLNKAGVDRNPNGKILYREPRNSCFLPEDYILALRWWIENSNKDITRLLNY